MSAKERVRLEIVSRVNRKIISVVKAADLAGVCERQMHRICRRYSKDGDGGLVHRGRGKPSNRRTSDATRGQIIRIYQEKYSDFGPMFACEKLATDGHKISPDTLTTILKSAGLWQSRRKRGKHRSRRERRNNFGSMLQMDGSTHDWFEGREDKCVLMVIVDDATGRVYIRFYLRENLEAAFDIFSRWTRLHGLPGALYVDRAAMYRPEREATGAELLAGENPVTQFGRAMKQLEVELILANSPQAKGRVERANGVFQDRLVKELRLAKISNIAEANSFLEEIYLEIHNEKYAVDAANEADAHRAVASDIRLEEILCEQENRVVGKDWCVRWKNQFFQIDRQHQALNLPAHAITIIEKENGLILLKHKNQLLQHTPIIARPKLKPPKPQIKNNKKWKPTASHPWNKIPICPGSHRTPSETAAISRAAG